jgi:hypothetical protein
MYGVILADPEWRADPLVGCGHGNEARPVSAIAMRRTDRREYCIFQNRPNSIGS